VRDVHQIVSGDTLESLAYRTYGDSGLWREIAAANDIDDPMRLRPGRTILLPAPEELGRG
jgi:nucleoid-associated protein YgaU